MAQSAAATPTPYRRALAFKRIFWVRQSKPDWVQGDDYAVVYPFETDDDKVDLVDLLVQDVGSGGLTKLFVEGFGLCDVTEAGRTEAGERCWRTHKAVRLLQYMHVGNVTSDVPRDDGDSGDEDEHTHLSLVFRIHTRDAKLEFAKWIAATRFGDFRQENTHIFFTSTIAAEAQPAPPAVEKKRTALHAFADLLFEHRDEMKGEVYRQLNKALKAAHDDE